MPALCPRTRVVLHHPFYPENLGAAARAVWACGLEGLDTVGGVEPAHPHARQLAVGAADWLDGATRHPALDPALAGAGLVVGTTSRPHREWRTIWPDEAAELARSAHGPIRLLFGNEKNGLSLQELRRCDVIARIPLAGEGRSLNLAQAIMVFAYEWLKADRASLAEASPGGPELAPVDALDALVAQAGSALGRSGFLAPPHGERRAAQLRRIAARMRLDRDELAMLRMLVNKLGWALEHPISAPEGPSGP